MGWLGKIHVGKPLRIKNRKELIAGIKPQHLQYLRADNGDLPDGYLTPAEPPKTLRVLHAQPGTPKAAAGTASVRESAGSGAYLVGQKEGE